LVPGVPRTCCSTIGGAGMRRVADYTLGLVIVMAQLLMMAWQERHRSTLR
jgi:hypothetical protein